MCKVYATVSEPYLQNGNQSETILIKIREAGFSIEMKKGAVYGKKL
jgi:hypothetical protein